MEYIYDNAELLKLIKEIESKISYAEITKIDKEILNKVADSVIPKIKEKAPISTNHTKSGVFRNSKRITPPKNAREYIDKSKIKKTKSYLNLDIGLEGTDGMDYAFYIKFKEFGTSRIKPNSFMYSSYKTAHEMLKNELMNEYNRRLNNL